MLLWALLIMFVLAITTASTIELVTSNEQAFGRDSRSTSALNIAEAGLNAAFVQIKAAADTTTTASGNGTLDHGTWSFTAVRTQDSQTDSTKFTWTITSTGIMAGTTHIVTDKLAQTIIPTTQTGTQTTTTPASPAYGYGVFLGAGTSDCTNAAETHPDTVGNSGVITTSVYVSGSLCLTGTSAIQEPATSAGNTVSVYIGGKIQTKGDSAPIGMATKKIKFANIYGGCYNVFKSNKPPFANNCSNAGDPTNSSSNTGVFANGYGQSQNPITKPTINTSWYSNAKPGPAYGCNDSPTDSSAKSSYPTGWTAASFDQKVLDNDTTRNTSISGSPTAGTHNIDFGQIVNRSGAHAANSFDCRYYDSSGNLIGRLAFNYPASGSESSSNPGYLTVYGTVFIDGNLDLGSNDYIEYQGVGTIYVNGTMTLENGAVLCAVPISGTPCLGNIDTTQNTLEIVAINAGQRSQRLDDDRGGQVRGHRLPQRELQRRRTVPRSTAR